MSFADTLNAYCEQLECTNREIAAACNISPSTLSRYLNGDRTPEASSQAVSSIATGLATLSLEAGRENPLSEEDVRKSLELSILGARMVGMNFNMRLDALMHLSGVRNVKMAEATQVDPSYISRIRKGSRKPNDMNSFSDAASRIIAQFVLDKGLVGETEKLIGDLGFEGETFGRGYDANSHLAEAVENWLLGDEIVEADVAGLEKLFEWLDTTDLSEWIALGDRSAKAALDEIVEPEHIARFYYGIDGMKSAEVDFLAMASETHARELLLSSDMPLLEMKLDHSFLVRYKRGLTKLLEAGCHISIVHGAERPLDETLQAMRMWIPLYLTGKVTPYYLKGIHNRLFCHVNYVCDTCALASEAMIGHQEDGRYFFTARPADIAYYRKKMGFILERSSRLLELYRDSVPEQRRAFEEAEKARRAKGHGRHIGEGRYQNLRAISYAADCTVFSVSYATETMHFVIRHPKINYAASRMK